MECVENFFKQLYQYDIITAKGFQMYQLEKMISCAAGLVSFNTKSKIICAFNIYNNNPDEVELNIQFYNNNSLEKLNVIGGKIAQKLHKDIKVAEYEESIEYYIYYNIYEVSEAVDMLIEILDELSNSVMFVGYINL